ncbi:unnamed protein product [Linum trigynum]|uniref:ZF-HD dimerization-type domain-containing protein n=1 Tax=Linum trigynum TaxID=586398 RepID=A0AAV2E651_9ROSI
MFVIETEITTSAAAADLTTHSLKGGSLEALKCAVCESHHNFHRKKIDGETAVENYLWTKCPPPRRRDLMGLNTVGLATPTQKDPLGKFFIFCSLRLIFLPGWSTCPISSSISSG